jgi:hypothetical protein
MVMMNKPTHRLTVNELVRDEHGENVDEQIIYQENVHGWAEAREAAVRWKKANKTKAVNFEVWTLDDEGEIDPNEMWIEFHESEVTTETSR